MPDIQPMEPKVIDYVYMTPSQVRKLLAITFGALDNQPSDRVILETFADRRPAEGPFISVFIRQAEPMWDSVPLFTDKVLDKEIYKSETWYTCDITTWGKNAFDRAQAIVYMLNYESRHTDIWRYVGGSSVGLIKDVSAIKGGHVLQRARFQFRFYILMSSQVKWDWFNRIEGELELVRQGSIYTMGFEAHA